MGRSPKVCYTQKHAMDLLAILSSLNCVNMVKGHFSEEMRTKTSDMLTDIYLHIYLPLASHDQPDMVRSAVITQKSMILTFLLRPREGPPGC